MWFIDVVESLLVLVAVMFVVFILRPFALLLMVSVVLVGEGIERLIKFFKKVREDEK